MPFSISGFVKDGKTLLGIKDVWILLINPSGDIIQSKTNEYGQYLFSDLTEIGSYIVYEIIDKLEIYPPIVFASIDGYEPPVNQKVLSVDSTGEDILISESFIHYPISPKETKSTHSLSIIKESSQNCASVGDIINYSLVCKNTGDINLQDILISDILAKEIEFISGSITINNISNKSANILSGIKINTLKVNESIEIKFKAKAIQSGQIENIATASYNYISEANPFPLGGTSYSNKNLINIYNISLHIKKSSNKQLALINDIITYTVTIENNGDLDVFNVLFKDELNRSISLIDGSFSINGQVVNGVNLSQGVNISLISKNTSVLIEYKAKVISTSYCGKLINIAKASYSYILPDCAFGSGETKSDEDSTNVINLAISNFKQFSIEEYACIPPQKPNIEDINSINGDIEIIRYHPIQTISSTSIEGQINSGYKLVVHGVLKLILAYTACDDCQSVHSAHYSIPFSTFITLPSDFDVSAKVEVYPDVEHIYYKNIDCRTIFINTTALLNAKILQC